MRSRAALGGARRTGFKALGPVGVSVDCRVAAFGRSLGSGARAGRTPLGPVGVLGFMGR